MDQIRCDELSFFGMDSNLRTCWSWQDLPADCDDGEAYDEAHWEHFWDFDPCAYPARSGDLRSVTKISDFYSSRQLHRTGMYSDYSRPLGLEHHLRLCLPACPGPAVGPGRTVELIFFRGPGPDFSERDRTLLALLRPHLHQAYLDAERRRRGTPPLTRRHWELLHLVAAGHTNAQIARRLGVSAGTVRKPWRTSTAGCRYPAAPPRSPARSPTEQPGSGRRESALGTDAGWPGRGRYRV